MKSNHRFNEMQCDGIVDVDQQLIGTSYAFDTISSGKIRHYHYAAFDINDQYPTLNLDIERSVDSPSVHCDTVNDNQSGSISKTMIAISICHGLCPVKMFT